MLQRTLLSVLQHTMRPGQYAHCAPKMRSGTLYTSFSSTFKMRTGTLCTFFSLTTTDTNAPLEALPSESE